MADRPTSTYRSFVEAADGAVVGKELRSSAAILIANELSKSL